MHSYIPMYIRQEILWNVWIYLPLSLALSWGDCFISVHSLKWTTLISNYLSSYYFGQGTIMTSPLIACMWMMCLCIEFWLQSLSVQSLWCHQLQLISYKLITNWGLDLGSLALAWAGTSLYIVRYYRWIMAGRDVGTKAPPCSGWNLSEAISRHEARWWVHVLIRSVRFVSAEKYQSIVNYIACEIDM